MEQSAKNVTAVAHMFRIHNNDAKPQGTLGNPQKKCRQRAVVAGREKKRIMRGHLS